MKSFSLAVLFFVLMSAVPSMVFGAHVAASAASAPQAGRISVERGNARNIVDCDDILNMDDADQQRISNLMGKFVNRFIGSLAMMMTGATQADSNQIKQDLHKLLDEMKKIIVRNIEDNTGFIAGRFASKEEARVYYASLHNEIKEWFIDNFESYVQRINNIPHNKLVDRGCENFRVLFGALRRDFAQISHILETEIKATVRPVFASFGSIDNLLVVSKNAPAAVVNDYVMTVVQNVMQSFMQRLSEKLPYTEKEKRLVHINKTIMGILVPAVSSFGIQMADSAARRFVNSNNVSEQDREEFKNSHTTMFKDCCEKVLCSIRQVLTDLTPSEDRLVRNSIVASTIGANALIERVSQVRTPEDFVAAGQSAMQGTI